MNISFRKTYNFAKRNPAIFLRVSLVILIFFSLLVFLSINTLAASSNELTTYNAPSKTRRISLPAVELENINTATVRQQKEEVRLAEIQKKLEIRQRHVDIINKFLVRKNSPVKNTKVAEIIYDKSQAYNADYKILLAIMGVESGFCAQSFHYNCFGYLNGAEYSSYEVAFKDLVPKVSRQYAAKYETDFVSLAKAYGMINWEKGASNLQMYYNQVGE